MRGYTASMPSHRDTIFPRSAAPHDIGVKIRAARTTRHWSQERLAQKVGVTRYTIMRIESGRHVPTSHLVYDLEEVLDLAPLVPSWPEPLRPADACYGPRIRQVRRAAGVTAAEAARVAGVSPATFSRFEAGATIEAVMGRFEERGEGVRSDALARLLGFEDAEALNAYCEA